MSETSNKIKKFPRDEDGNIRSYFMANGKKYLIRSADEGVGIDRFTMFEKLSIPAGFARSFQAIFEALIKAEKLANGVLTKDNTFTDLAYHLKTVTQGIQDKTEERYNICFYICTLFIVLPEENLSNWSEREADEKIEDWKKEGLDANDFLSLALGGIRGFWSAYQEMTEKIKKMSDTLVDI